MDKPLISIIVPIYKVEKYLERCVQSIVDQTYQNLEILLIDDGSPDNCPAMCDAWAEKDSRIKVIHKENMGVSAARNSGIEIANGELLFFLDGDDIIEAETVSACIKYYDGKKSTIVLVNNDRVSDEYSNDEMQKRKVVGADVAVYNGLAITSCISARTAFACWGILMSKPLINEKQIRFDEVLHNLEDAAFLGKFLCYIDKIICLMPALYHYRRTPASITSNCINRKWQAQGWLNARIAILRYFQTKGSISPREEKHIKRMNRLCLNNFYAELFSGMVSFKDANMMVLSSSEEAAVSFREEPIIRKYLHYKLKYGEFIAYKIALWVQNMLRRKIRR